MNKTTEKSGSVAYIYAGIAVILWASAFSGVKYALNWYSPGAIMLLRFSVASVTLLIIAAAKKARLPAREDLPYILLAGAIGIFGYMMFFNIGTNMVKSGISSFIIAAAPIITMLLSVVFLKEKLRPLSIVGVAISACGLILIAVSQVREVSLNFGILILLAASAFTSFYNIIQRKISYKYTPIECTAYPIFFATLLMLVFSGELIRDFPKAPPLASGVIIFMGVFPAALAYLFWNYAIGKAEKVINVSNFLYLVPFVATALGFFFLGEVLPPLAIVGGVTIIAGMVLANYSKRRT